MKKFYFILIVGIIFFIISLVKKQYRFRLTAMFLVVVTVANVFYNSAGLEKIISLIRPVNQLIYQPEYEEELKYPDAVLPFIIKGKKIHMKNDFLRIHESKELGFGWVYSYYHVHNAMNFVNHNGAEAIATMYCGTIENNTAEAGGGIANYVSDCTGTATAEIKGGKIISNTATSIGGGIFNSGNSATAKVVISGNTEISGNSAVSADKSGGEGGGIYNTAVLELNGGSIRNNTAISTGAVVNTKTGVFTMTDGTISGNKALQENISSENLGNVGGIYNDGKMEMSGGSITGNTAKHCGGVFSKGTITLKKTAVIKDNTEQDNAPANLFVGAGKLEPGIEGDALTAGADVHYTVCKIGSHSVISMTDKIDASPVAEGVPTGYLTPDVVCRIGDATDNVAYATLQKAVRNVKSGSTITLLKDNAENVTVSSGKKFTIDENGKSFNPEKVTGELGIKLTREDNKNLHVYNSVDYGATVKNFFNKLNEIGLSELIGAHVKLIGVKLLAIVEIIKNSGNLFAEIFR